MPSLILATRLTLMLSKSSGFKNIRPRVLYLLHTSVGQWYIICTLSSFSSPHSRQSCRCVSPRLKIRSRRVLWPVNRPTATLSFDLLIAWRYFVLLARGSLISVLDCRKTLQAFHLHRYSCLKWLRMTSLSTAKEVPTIWDSIVLSLVNLSVTSLLGIPWCPCIHTIVVLLDTLIFFWRLHTLPNQNRLSGGFWKCCYCCPAS